MWVRIARFEGGVPSEATVAEVRERISTAVGGEGPPVKRTLLLADPQNQRGANVMFCETEDDLRRVDEYMNAMTPVSERKRSKLEFASPPQNDVEQLHGLCAVFGRVVLM